MRERVLASQRAVGMRDLPSPRHAELLTKNVAVRLRRSWRDAEPLSNLLVRATGRDQLHDLPLSRGQNRRARLQHRRHSRDANNGVLACLLTERRISRRTPRSLRRAPLAEQELVQIPVCGHRSADVARVDRLSALDVVRDPARLEELGHHFGIRGLVRLLLGKREPALGQHPLNQIVELRQRFRRRVDDERLQRLPLRLPLVSIEPWFDHGGKMRAADPFETLIA